MSDRSRVMGCEFFNPKLKTPYWNSLPASVKRLGFQQRQDSCEDRRSIPTLADHQTLPRKNK